MLYIGCDVSHNNGKISWDKVAKAKVDFTIIRAGYGWSANKIDKQFVYNITNALKYGIDVGCYWFSYAGSPAEARLEANLFLKTIKPYRLEYPIAFDWEYDSVDYNKKRGIIMTPILASAIADAFLSTCVAAGYYVVNYTNNDFIQRYFNQPCMKKYENWIARWSVFKPSNITGLWQNEVRGTTSNISKGLASVVGGLSGVSGAIDMNISFKDYPTIIKAAGLNHLAKAPTVPVTVKEVFETPKAVTFKAKDKVKVLKNIIYGTNKTFVKYFSTYDVLYDQKGDRVIIGKYGKITTSIAADNLKKV